MSLESMTEGDHETQVIFETNVEESSEGLPIDEWSSLVHELPEENRKQVLYEQGLYNPDSGEICTHYISISASSVLRHPYFHYPAVLDPGIEEALLKPEPKIRYTDDGQALYLDICKQMKQCPVRKFHRGLLTDKIDLKYYCVNPFGVRAMATALSFNLNVTIFDLTANFLNDDACFHLGEMLKNNTTLKELILSRCRMGSKGIQILLNGLLCNKYLQALNLNKNSVGDTGLEYLSSGILKGINLKEVYLSYNNISGKAANILGEALQICNKLTVLDLSWNNLYARLEGTVSLLYKLSESKILRELYLAWNALAGLRIGNAIKSIFGVPSLCVLDLSNNMLSGEGVQNFVELMHRPKKLVTLNLSFNPLTQDDAFKALQKMNVEAVKIKNLLMGGVLVDENFLTLLDQIKRMKSKQDTVITYGGVRCSYQITGSDSRDLVLNRVEFLTMTGRKRKVDVALVILQMEKDNIKIMNQKAFEEALSTLAPPLNSDLIGEMVNSFPGPKTGKIMTVNISLMADFIRRKWPDRNLPPTPPPPPPKPPLPQKIRKTKGKK